MWSNVLYVLCSVARGQSLFDKALIVNVSDMMNGAASTHGEAQVDLPSGHDFEIVSDATQAASSHGETQVDLPPGHDYNLVNDDAQTDIPSGCGPEPVVDEIQTGLPTGYGLEPFDGASGGARLETIPPHECTACGARRSVYNRFAYFG